MIKRLIFDIDNTLIIWKDEYIRGVQNAINSFNLNIDSKLIDDIINSLEYKYDILSKEVLLKEINDNCHTHLDMTFINEIFNEQKKLSEENTSVVDTLKYLSTKYELVILTNYFREVQIERLKQAGIYSYFKEIYCGDEVLLKPNKESFKIACGSYNYNECMMIGDNYKIDVEPALKLGIKVIVCNYFNKISSSNKYAIIKRFDELKKIL